MKLKLVLLLSLLVLASHESADIGSGLDTDLLEEGSGSALSASERYANATSSCVEQSISSMPDAAYGETETVIITVISVRVVILSLLLLGGVSLNSLVLYLVAKYKQLHTLSFAVALQVVVTDLLLSLMLFVPSMISTVARRWILGKHACFLTGLVTQCLLHARGILMLVFVIDRFMSVFFPFFYPKHKVKIAVTLSALSWLLTTLLAVLALPSIFDYYRFYPTTYNGCYFDPRCNKTCSLYNSFVSFISVSTIVVPVVLFGALWYKGRLFRKKTSTASSATDDEELCRSERRATVTYTLLFVGLFAIIVPTTAISLAIQMLFPDSDDLPLPWSVVQSITGAIIVVFVITDPILIMRHRDVRDILAGLCERKR